MKYLNKKTSILFLISVMTVSLSFSQSTLKVEKVIIFTDGNAYFQKSGEIEVRNGIFELSGDELPVARFGTLEITDADNSILNITSSIKPKQQKPKPYSIKNAKDLLSQNKGIRLEIKTKDNLFSGVLSDVYPDYILLKSDKTIMIKTADILSFSFDSEPVFLKSPKQNKSPVQLNVPVNDYNKDVTLAIHFSSEGSKTIDMKYLQKGLSWSPMYTLRLIDGKRAKLLLQAEVINDAEDLDDTQIDLVLGTPNFKYDMYLTDLLDYNNLLDPFYDNNNHGNSRYQHFADYFAQEKVSSGTNNEDDEQKHDFFIHKLQNISLEKNSRGLYKIFETDVPCRQIYECDLIELEYKNSNYNRKNKGPQNKVYHSILIKNNSNMLFGKGAVLVVDGTRDMEMPLAQNILEYIPPQSEGIIKITESPEVDIAHKERIIARSQEKVDFWGYKYYKTKIEGTILVKNYKSESIEMFVRDIISGELIDIGANGEVLYQKQPFYSPNYKSKVKWTLDMKPGEEQEIKYQYELLVKS